VKLALTLDTRDEHDLIFCQQVGVRYVLSQPDAWDLAALRAMRHRAHIAGLELLAVEALPPALYANALLGAPGADAEIAALQQMLRDLGAAGIATVAYRWAPPTLERTTFAPLGRGGAQVRGYDPALLVRDMPSPPGLNAEALWINLARFLDALLPVAEHAGVRLAAQLDCPPRASVGGVPRILVGPAAIRRFLDLAPSPAHGLDLHTETVALIPDSDLNALIRQIARRGKLFMLRLGSVQPHGDGFRECFLDEGIVSVPQVLRTLRELGYTGIVRTAPPPTLVGDTDWGHKGRAHDIGYVKALSQVVEQLP